MKNEQTFLQIMNQFIEALLGEFLYEFILRFCFGAACGFALVGLFYVAKWTLLLLFAPLLN